MIRLLAQKSLLIFVMALTACHAPVAHNPAPAANAASVPLPPLPPGFPARAGRQLAAAPAEAEPVGYYKLVDRVSTNALGHVEFSFDTQTFWQGWALQQSDAGAGWQTFAESTATNGVWESTNFIIVNGSPTVYPDRSYRLLRTK